MYGIEGLSLDVLGKDELRLVYLALRIRYEKDKERLDEAWRSDPGYTVRKRTIELSIERSNSSITVARRR